MLFLRLLSHDKKHFTLCEKRVKDSFVEISLGFVFIGSLFAQVIHNVEFLEVKAKLKLPSRNKSKPYVAKSWIKRNHGGI